MNLREKVERLVTRIQSGQVLFFIGAGFSIDSEGNTAYRLMRRLLVRFQSMVNLLEEKYKSGIEFDEISALPKILRETFQLNRIDQRNDWQLDFPWQAEDDKDKQLRSDISALSSKYFEANEWFCGSFQRLLQLSCEWLGQQSGSSCTGKAVVNLDAARDFIVELSERENALLMRTGSEPDPVPFELMDVRLLAWSNDMLGDPVLDRTQNAGKALFLDTMGFANPQIMGGDWLADQRSVTDNYNSKLLPRFHVLGRLAREGMCPTIVTTNYDLLLEGAWRAVGFSCNGSQKNSFVQPNLLPNVPFAEMARIGKAAEFFEYGRGNATANVVKVHGCTYLYRQAREQGGLDMDRWAENPASVSLNDIDWKAWRKYLPSMVFTYREIQNWRGDSWARDFLATVQRTRTVAFCGYSLQDPVLHDTFRSVYEDMSRQLLRTELNLNPKLESIDAPALDAPAFFWSPAGMSSFYATEVLDSATTALGYNRVERKSHPNAIDYQFRNNDKNCFPDLDDLFLLIFHQVFRSNQVNCAQSDLTQVLSSLLGRLVLKKEIESFERRFKAVVKDEKVKLFKMPVGNLPTTAQQARITQRQFRDIVNWTYGFGSSLLREIAAIELLQRSAGHSLELATMRSPGWYLPTQWNRSVTAWGVVVELAIRTLFAGPTASLSSDCQKTCLPTDENFPTIYFRLATGNQPLPKDAIALQIITGGSQMQRSLRDAARSHYCVEWSLEFDRFPWQVERNQSVNAAASGHTKRISPPTAAELWTLASLGPNCEAVRSQLITQLEIPGLLGMQQPSATTS